MKKNEQSGTSTPNAPTGTVSATGEATVVYEFPRAQDITPGDQVMFGDRKESLRVSDTEMVEIDAYFFASQKSLRLKNIKTALKGLKTQGVKLPDGKEIGQRWFNDNVRDPFHKVLRYAARYSLKNGEPISLAFSRRTNKDTGAVITTARHAFAFKTAPTKPDEIEEQADKAADKASADAKRQRRQSLARAKRQQGKKNLQPLVSPEAANRIDALIEQTAADKAATPATNGEQK